MTTHDRDKVIATAKEAGCELRETPDGLIAYLGHSRTSDVIERLYAIAYEAGRVAEREDCAKDKSAIFKALGLVPWDNKPPACTDTVWIEPGKVAIKESKEPK
jgi:hypothetical protein